MAELLKGKPVVDSMALDLRARIEALGRAKVVPALALVRVGQRPDDLSYERTARKRAESLGIAIRPYELDEFAPQAAIEAAIHEVNRDENVHGCLLFRPLPSFVDESHVCELLDPKKDIDGITLASLASVFTDGHAGYPPATAAACIQLLDHYQVPLQGKHVVVVGRSLVVGKPVSMMLLRRNASVTICHSKTENLADIMRSADVVICATGRARTFGAQFFGPGQTVLDVGINFDTQGNLCGDVDFAEVEPVVAAITPVPGGIGTVTTSVTMAHTVASSPMGRKFVIADPATCIGCKTCMAACFHRHDVPNDVAVPRLTLVTTRTISAPVGCHHCAEAPCVDACPTGCLFTDDEHVGVHPDKCIGCRNCVLACPYGAVEIVTEKLPPEPEAASGTEAAAASAQDDKGARARARAKKRKRTKSTVVKCDLCLDRAGGPACAAACPTKALRLIDAQFMERARQNKRKAAARASASFASMKLNAALDEGE